MPSLSRNTRALWTTTILALVAGLVLVLALPSVASAGCARANAHPSNVSLKVIKRATRCLVNAKRDRRGLPRLRGNRKLSRAARKHSVAMESNNFFSHYGLNGSSSTDRIRATGYLRGSRSWATGENIGWGSHGYATPRRMVRAWMRSRGHRANILSSSFRHMGLGIARGAPVGGYGKGVAATYTTDFGRN